MPSSDRYLARHLIGKVLIASRENKHRDARAYIECLDHECITLEDSHDGYHGAILSLRSLMTRATCCANAFHVKIITHFNGNHQQYIVHRQMTENYPRKEILSGKDRHDSLRGVAFAFEHERLVIKSAYSQLDEFKFPYLIVRADICPFL